MQPSDKSKYIREDSVVPVILNQIALYNASQKENPHLQVPDYVQEFSFCDWRQWRADVAWPEQKLLLEIEGGTRNAARSRHTTSVGYDEDCVKYSTASVLGYTLIRCTGRMIHDGEALALVLHALSLITREDLAKALPVKSSPYSKAGRVRKHNAAQEAKKRKPGSKPRAFSLRQLRSADNAR